MNRITEVLIADVKLVINETLESCLYKSSNVDAKQAFSLWLIGGDRERAILDNFKSQIIANQGAHNLDYIELAVLGFCLDLNILNQEECLIFYKSSNAWSEKAPFLLGDDPAPFVFDFAALIGIALGAAKNETNCDFIRTWMSKFLYQSYNGARTKDWQRYLINAIQVILKFEHKINITSDKDAYPFACSLYSKGIICFKHGITIEEYEILAFEYIKNFSIASMCLEQVAACQVCIKWLLRSVPLVEIARPTTKQICGLLEQFPKALQFWTWETEVEIRNRIPRKWSIDNEYHVQNMLWFMLAPIFPDLEKESNLPPVGQLNPRADLLIRSMRVLIEVKFIRKTDRFSNMILSIAEKIPTYLIDKSQFEKFILFIWDDSARTQEHQSFKEALERFEYVESVVIVSRPSSFEELPAPKPKRTRTRTRA